MTFSPPSPATKVTPAKRRSPHKCSSPQQLLLTGLICPRPPTQPQRGNRTCQNLMFLRPAASHVCMRLLLLSYCLTCSCTHLLLLWPHRPGQRRQSWNLTQNDGNAALLFIAPSTGRRSAATLGISGAAVQDQAGCIRQGDAAAAGHSLAFRSSSMMTKRTARLSSMVRIICHCVHRLEHPSQNALVDAGIVPNKDVAPMRRNRLGNCVHRGVATR